MNAYRAVWKVTFSDGAWVKMIGFADIERAYQQAGHEFGEFSTMELLPEMDAAVIAWKDRAAKLDRCESLGIHRFAESYQDGYLAFTDGLPHLPTNPYKFGTQEYANFAQGYSDSKFAKEGALH